MNVSFRIAVQTTRAGLGPVFANSTFVRMCYYEISGCLILWLALDYFKQFLRMRCNFVRRATDSFVWKSCETRKKVNSCMRVSTGAEQTRLLKDGGFSHALDMGRRLRAITIIYDIQHCNKNQSQVHIQLHMQQRPYQLYLEYYERG